MSIDKKDYFVTTELSAAGPSGASAPSEAPPSFEDVPPLDTDAVPKYTEHAFEDAYIPTGGEEPPPEFTPYEAEYFISGREIVSHDPHLNKDGEALYRFLLSKATLPPSYLLHVRGTHSEHRTRTVFKKDQQGNFQPHTEHYTETVTDFDFFVDVGAQIAHGPIHWSVPDYEPAYRGRMVKEVETQDVTPTDTELGARIGRRKATKEELKNAKERLQLRDAYGLPPWVRPDPGYWYDSDFASASREPAPSEAQVMRSSKTLREWADEYCASDKILKEFTYTKVVYGWNTAGLKKAVQSAVRSVYSDSLTVDFEISHDRICIRPDNRLSRTLSNKWLKFLLWLLLLYPFIWLYKRFGRRGGGRWEVCGGAYALKTWRLEPGAALPPPEANGGRWRQTPDGPAHLLGEREGEWFQRWQGPIRNAVMHRVQSKTPLEPANAPNTSAEGYRPVYI